MSVLFEKLKPFLACAQCYCVWHFSRNLLQPQISQPMTKQIKSEQFCDWVRYVFLQGKGFWISVALIFQQTVERKYNHTKAAQNTWCFQKQYFLLSPSFFLTNMKSSKLELNIPQEEALQQLGCITVEWW